MKLFKDLPNTDTPINAENLNQIQDNLVVVSPTEPTGDNREKVWIQKGKNLFNKNNYNLYKGFIHGENLFFVNNDYANTVYLRVKPNTTYTISRKIVHTDFAIGTGSFIPIANEQRINSYRDYKNELSATITTGTEDKYIYIYLLWSDGATTTLEEVLQGLQIEQGTTATEFEAYIEPKIYVKNDNDVYEEFISKEDTLVKYSTEEQLIGEWHNGNNVYRKTLLIDVSSFNDEQEHFINYSDYGISGNIVVNNYKGLCERSDQVWQVLPCTLEEWHIDIYDFKETQFTIKISQNQKNIGLRILTLVLEYEHRSW